MSIRDQLASGAGATLVDDQTFTASGTWTKPSSMLPTDRIVIDMCGGGGGGGHAINNDATKQTGTGGGGGGHNHIELRGWELNASETVTVGAGGAGGTAASPTAGVLGTAGGFSDFKGFRAYGGGPGYNQFSSSPGGSGGGTLSAGGNNGATGSNPGGSPQTTIQSLPNAPGASAISDIQRVPTEWGGGDGVYAGGISASGTIHGGAGAIPGQASNFRSSIWGGGAGGSCDTSGDTGVFQRQGGTSVFGGAGGSAVPAATTNGNSIGGDGGVRGGGGGGGKGTGKGGDGGRGEVRIRVLRGI